MKAIRKGIVGILFLLPLLLPATTRAGGIDEWLRSFFQPNSNRPVMRPADNSYRPYEPFNRSYNPYYSPYERGRQYRPAPSSGQDGNAVPIDGGLVLLLAAGLAFGAWKVYDLKKGSTVTDLG